MNNRYPSVLTGRLLAAAAVACMGVASAADVAVPDGSTPTATPVTTPSSPSLRQQSFVMQLAKADLSKQGITEPTTEQLALAASKVQGLRDQGMGWGAIANSLGLRFGAVVSAAQRADEAEKAERAALRKTKPQDADDVDSGRREVAGLGAGRPSDGGKGGGDGSGNSGRSGNGASGGGQSGGSHGGGNAGNGGGGKGGGNAGGNSGGNSGGKGGGNSGGKGGGKK